VSEPSKEEIDWIENLIRLDAAGERTTIAIGPYSAFSLICLLQLATRHPQVSPMIKRAALSVARQLYPLFEGTAGEEMIKKGEHPEWDI